MITFNPEFTCGNCNKSFILVGRVDIKELNKNWLHCPWCSKILVVLTETEVDK